MAPSSLSDTESLSSQTSTLTRSVESFADDSDVVCCIFFFMSSDRLAASSSRFVLRHFARLFLNQTWKKGYKRLKNNNKNRYY